MPKCPMIFTIASRSRTWSITEEPKNPQSPILGVWRQGLAAARETENPDDRAPTISSCSTTEQATRCKGCSMPISMDGLSARIRKHLDNLSRAIGSPSIFSQGTAACSTSSLHKRPNYLPEHLKHPEQLKVPCRRICAKNSFAASWRPIRTSARKARQLCPRPATRPVHEPLRAFEVPLVENHFLTMKIGVGPRCGAHEEFSSLTHSLVSRNVKSLRRNDAVRPVDAPIYLDFAHTNELGNKLIARLPV